MPTMQRYGMCDETLLGRVDADAIATRKLVAFGLFNHCLQAASYPAHRCHVYMMSLSRSVTEGDACTNHNPGDLEKQRYKLSASPEIRCSYRD